MGPKLVRHCDLCAGMVWRWYGKLYTTRDAALAARKPKAKAQKKAVS